MVTRTQAELRYKLRRDMQLVPVAFDLPPALVRNFAHSPIIGLRDRTQDAVESVTHYNFVPIADRRRQVDEQPVIIAVDPRCEFRYGCLLYIHCSTPSGQ